MCKQSGTNTQTVVQNPTPPAWLSTAFENLASRAQTASNTPYNPATQRDVADFSPDQLQAFQMTRDNAGQWSPYVGAATNYAQIGGSPITGDQIANYMNPFQSQVIDATLGNIQQNNQIQANNLRGNAALQGGLGNDRLGVAQAELARNQNLATNQTLATLNAQNFNQGLGAAQQDRSAAQQAAQQFGNLGTQVSNLGASDASRIAAAGGLQQQLAQTQLDTTSSNIAAQEQYPFATASWLGGMLQGASPTFTGMSQSTSTPGPSPLNSILGLGALGLGAWAGMPSDERVKDDVTPIGTDFAGKPIYSYRMKGSPVTQLGYLAQDLIETAPESVRETPDGLLMVDYELATADAERRGLAGLERPGYNTGGPIPQMVTSGKQFANRQPTQVGTAGPYAGASPLDASMIAAQGMGMQAPQPKWRDVIGKKPKSSAEQMAEDAQDVLGSFKTGSTAGRGINKGLGSLMTETSTGEGGWQTTVAPEGQGVWNMLGFADGGGVMPYDSSAAVPYGQAPGLGALPAAPGPAAGSFRAAQGMPAPIAPVGDPAAASAAAAGSFRGAQEAGLPPADPNAIAGAAGTPALAGGAGTGPFGFNPNPASIGLMQAGLGMLASRSPFPQVALGEGGARGLQAYQAAAAREIENKRREEEAARLTERFKLEQERLKLDQTRTSADIDARRAEIDLRRAEAARAAAAARREDEMWPERQKVLRRQAMTPAEIAAEEREMRRQQIEALRQREAEAAAAGRKIDPYTRYELTGELPKDETEKPIIVPEGATVMSPSGQKIGEGAPKKPDSTSMKYRFEAEKELPKLDYTLKQLEEAESLLTAQAPTEEGQPDRRPYFGWGAQSRAAWNQGTPDGVPNVLSNPDRSKSTQRLNIILGEQSIQQMAAALSGATTNEEMQAFRDLINNPNVREEVKVQAVRDMLAMARNQKAIALRRIEELGGTVPEFARDGAAPGGSGRADRAGGGQPKVLQRKTVNGRNYVQVEVNGKVGWFTEEAQ